MPNIFRTHRRGGASGSILVFIIGGAMLLVVGYLFGSIVANSNPNNQETADGSDANMTEEERAAERERIQEIANYNEHRRQNSEGSKDGPNFGWTRREDAPSRSGGADTTAGGSLPPINPRNGSEFRPTTPTAPPPIAIEPTTLDFGNVSPHAKLNGEILIRNTSDAPVTILKTVSSCTCTAVDLSNTVIEPGASIPMNIDFETNSRLGVRNAGVRILLDGMPDHVINANITANVQLAVAAIPSYISTLESPAGVTTIKSIDGAAFNILAVDGHAPTFIGFDPANDDPRNEYLISWDFSEVDPKTCMWPDGRRVRPFLVVETDHAECPVLDILVRDECTVITPPKDGRQWVLGGRRELVGELEVGESHEFTVAMKWLPNANPNDQIYEVTAESPNFKVELINTAPTKDGFNVDIRVTLTEYHKGGLIYEQIWVHSRNHYAPFLLTGRAAK